MRGTAPALTAVIAAAGSGERLGAGGPKAFVPLAGRPMIEWSLEAFRAAAGVRAIVVAAPPDLVPDLDASLAADAGRGAPPVAVLAGGATRSRSVANALAAVETELVAIHDAARPLLTARLVEDLVAALVAAPEAAGAIAAAPVTDTIKRARSRPAPEGAGESAGPVVAETVDRATLWAAQTPQVFRLAALREALAVPEAERDAATDEAMLVEAAGGTVLIHPSGPENLKVTTPHDLRVAALLLSEAEG